MLIRNIPHAHAVGLVPQSIMIGDDGNTPDHAGIKHALHALHHFRRCEAQFSSDGMIGPG